MVSLISPRSLAPSLSLFFFLFSFAGDGRELYLKHCAQCHHESRIGRTAPPLIPQFLKRKSDEYLFKVIREGIPATTMGSFGYLSDEDVRKIVEFIKSPVGRIAYSLEDIKESRSDLDRSPRELNLKDVNNLIVFVDKAQERYG